MASVQSLGLQEPSALSYLVAESVLPPEPPASAYKWRHQLWQQDSIINTDEILIAKNTVVWSRNSIIRRVYNLQVEGEALLDAFITHFVDSSKARNDDRSDPHSGWTGGLESALVVILRTQAHIYLSSGDTHVLPLPFETGVVFPLPRGFVLQSKQPENEERADKTGFDSLGPSSRGVNLGEGRLWQHNDEATRGADQDFIPTASGKVKHPRTYSYTDIISDIGLVVVATSRQPSELDQCKAFPAEEEILYTSALDEFEGDPGSQREPFYTAVTLNVASSTLSVWQIIFNESDQNTDYGLVPGQPKKSSRRKSSNIFGHQAGIATPLPRVPGTFQESFAPIPLSLAESSVLKGSKDQISKQGEDLAAQLGHEFEHTGVQTRSARRVSSMLARTDLGGAADRNTFNELPLGLQGRKSFGVGGHRGESLGGLSERQSFGRRRSSFQANSSILSEGTSFLDIPASHLLDEGQNLQLGIDTQEGYVGSIQQRPRDVGLMKLKSIHFSRDSTSLLGHNDFRVITILAPDRSTADERRSRILSVCVLQRSTCEMTTFSLAIKPQLSSSRSTSMPLGNEVRVVGIHRNRAVVDICRIRDGPHQRLLTLTNTRDDQTMLQLESPWSPPYRLDLPAHYKAFEQWSSTLSNTLPNRLETGIPREINGSDVKLMRFGSAGGNLQPLVIDQNSRIHALHVRLIPTNPIVYKILQLASFIFDPEQKDNLLVAWWEVKRWLQLQDHSNNLEWTAITVTIFLLAVPFISKSPGTPKVGHRRTKSSILRSSSGATVDMDNSNSMNQVSTLHRPLSSWEDAAWGWLKLSGSPRRLGPNLRASQRQASTASLDDEKIKETFLIRCSNLAREFMQSPTGEAAMGPEGYLPIAVNKEREQRRTALASMLVGLHLLREEQKLHTLAVNKYPKSTEDLGLIITQLAVWLKWPDWTAARGNYYATEIECCERWLYDESVIDSLETPSQRFEPPSIFQHIEEVIINGSSGPFLSLLDLIAQSRHISSRHPLRKTAVSLTPHTFALISFFGSLSFGEKPQKIIQAMASNHIDRETVQAIPDGVAAIFHKVIGVMRARPPMSWSHQLYELVDRTDLKQNSDMKDLRRPTLISHAHEALKDYRAISQSAIEADVIMKWDASSEIDRQTVTKLIFKDDRRFQEASKLVNQSRPPVVECVIKAGWTESDLLEAQKELAQHVSRRTFAVSAGRGMMHFNARVPLLTERVPIPAFTPQCVIKPSDASDHAQSMTFSADKTLFTEEKTCWAFFHNGASAGLMISRDSKWIDTSWILYNKPNDLTNRHAGFLLALGLNGHLVSLAKWVAFKYLTPKHTMTSVGLLLGLAASYLGTSDTLITRLMSVHVTRLLPPGAAELNLSPLTQTAGLIGIGLLYHNSQHRRMSEVMLSEIENSDPEERSGEEPILRDEGYRLAAGFSLGLINLGHGGELHSLHDMSLVERLLTIAIGPKNVNLVHVLDRATAGSVIAIAFIYMKTNNEALAQKIDIPDTLQQFEYVRPDIFLLRTLARHLIMWDRVQPSRDFIKDSLPSSYQRRAELKSTKRLSTDDLPFFNITAGLCFAISLRYAGSHRTDVRDLLVTYLDQFWRLSKLPALNYDAKVTLNSVRNCLDVLALSCATVMAGSGDLMVMRRLRALHGRTDPDTPYGSHLAAHMALGALFLGGGTATFSTSNLSIASLIIAFYPLFPTDVLDNRGHLQALRHFWVLAVDNRCLVSRDMDTGQIVGGIEAQLTLADGSKQTVWTPSLLPELDNILRIQFNHDSYWPVDLILSSPSPNQKHPDNINGMKVKGPSKYRTLRDDWKSDPKKLSISLLRRSDYEKPRDATSTFASELRALDAGRGIPSLDANAPTNERWKHTHGHPGTDGQVQNPLDWIFNLDAFGDLDHAEIALVLGEGGVVNSGASATTGGDGRKMLYGTVIDTRLEFEQGVLGPDTQTNDQPSSLHSIPTSTRLNKDKLWQLRLLLAWSDRWDQEAERETARRQSAKGGTDDAEHLEKDSGWLKREVVERLRWRVWQLANGEASTNTSGSGNE